MLSRLTRPLLAATAAAAALLVLPAGASAQASCPNANLIVQENYCASGATSNYRLSNASENIGGFATKTSFDRGENIPLKIARNQPTFPANRVDITVYRTGSYGGAGLPPDLGGRGDRGGGQQRLHLQPDERHHRGARLRQLERDVHDPRLLPARDGRVRGKDPDDRHGPGQLDLLRRSRRRPLAGGPGPRRDSHGDLPGLQHLGRQVPLLRQERRRGHRLRHQARRQGLVQPAPGRSDAPARRLLRTRLRHGPVARGAGLRRHLHGRRRDPPGPDRAAPARGGPDHRPFGVLVQRGVQRRQGGQGRRREHRLLQREHRLLEGALRERHSQARLLQDRPGRRLGVERPRQRQRLGTGRPGEHGRRRARPRPPRGHGRRPPRELHHHLPRQRRASRRPQRTGTRPRRPGHAGEPAVRCHVLRRQRQPQLRAASAGGQPRRRVLGRPDLAPRRPASQRGDVDRHEHRGLGVGLGPDSVPVPEPPARRGQAREQHPDDE